MPLACQNRALRQPVASFHRRSIAELEFGDDYRDPRFPSGWYVLPSVGLSALAVVLVLLL